MERVLTRAGFQEILGITDSRRASTVFSEFQPDLVLTDWLMPHLDGAAVIERLRALVLTAEFLPIIVLTADITPQTKKRALRAGASDFLTKPFDQLEVALRITNLLKVRLLHSAVKAENEQVEANVRLRIGELENALTKMKRAQVITQQEQLVELSTTVGDIAHDFGNALSTITTMSGRLLRDAERDFSNEQAVQPLRTIHEAAEAATKLVRRLRDLQHDHAVGEERLRLS